MTLQNLLVRKENQAVTALAVGPAPEHMYEIAGLQLLPTGRCSASVLYPFNTPRIIAA
jgi:hypothetical protein